MKEKTNNVNVMSATFDKDGFLTVPTLASIAFKKSANGFSSYPIKIFEDDNSKKQTNKKVNRIGFCNGDIVSETTIGEEKIINYSVIPDISAVETIERDGKTKVVLVYFTDGTFQKASVSGEDVFSLEQGISICITKKLLDIKTGSGSTIYNKIIKRALNIKKKNEIMSEEAVKLFNQNQKKLKKIAEKKAKRKAKIEAAKREREIEIQTEAIIRANRKMKEEKNNFSK